MAERTPWRTCAAPASTATRCARTACCQDTARRCMSSSDRHEPTSAWPCSPCSAVTASWSASTACCATCARRNPKQAMGSASPPRWDGAARTLAKSSEPLDVWLVRTLPRSRRHPDMLSEWIALDYDVHVIETPASETFALDLSHQEYRTAQQWYSLHLTQQAVDARMAARRQRLAALDLRHGDDTARPRW